MAEKITIKNAALVKGEEITVRGKLGFTKYLTKVLEGKELEEVVAKRQYATEDPHYEGTITSPKVVCKTKGKPTDAERVIAGRIYSSKDADGNAIQVLSLERKMNKQGTSKIAFGVKREDGIHPVDLQGKALATGQEVEVTYVTREYEYKNKKGLSLFLDSIVFVAGEPELYKAQVRKGWVDEDSTTETATETTEEAAEETANEEGVWDE